MPLNELDRGIVSFCEQSWFLRGSLPTPELLQTEFKMTARAIKAFLEREEIQESFDGRGIPTIVGRSLSPDQITAINTILNFADTRSEKKKLADMNISTVQWNGWRANPAFKEYLLNRTEGILADSIPDVNVALVDRARNGDLGAIKLVYEMTGRYRGNEAGVDVRQIMHQVLEIITMEVQDPVALNNISRRLLGLAGIDQPANIENEPPVAGEVIHAQIEGTINDSNTY